MSTLYDSFDDRGLFHFNRGSHVPVHNSSKSANSLVYVELYFLFSALGRL